MPKRQYKIPKVNQDRLDNIEKILKDYDVKFDNSSSILANHIIEFKNVVKEIHSQIFNNQEEVKRVNEKLDSILNVRVNGYVGLENILKVIVDSTKSNRANHNLINSIKDWIDAHQTVKLVLTSKLIVIPVTILLTVTLLTFFGFQVNIIDIIKNIF